jgi:hypothetical protein
VSSWARRVVSMSSPPFPQGKLIITRNQARVPCPPSLRYATMSESSSHLVRYGAVEAVAVGLDLGHVHAQRAQHLTDSTPQTPS